MRPQTGTPRKCIAAGVWSLPAASDTESTDSQELLSGPTSSEYLSPYQVLGLVCRTPYSY